MIKIILSNVAQYQALFEEVFVEFLVQKKVSGKTQKNYRTDLRHFMSWLITALEKEITKPIASHQDLLSTITPWIIHQYKTWMMNEGTPLASINRRLSALRMFFQCCLYKSWLHINPAISVPNATPAKKSTKDTTETLIAQFRQALETSGAAKSTIKNYIADVSDFLNWIAKQERPL